ncbi:MAG TPA: spore germination protein [Sporolactobacillaceae bacterium]|nr:spore germination protein [Sporolactobacillaceae bacterium]
MNWIKKLFGTDSEQDSKQEDKKTLYNGKVIETIKNIKEILKENDDLQDRPLDIAGRRATLIFISTIVEKQQVMYIIEELQKFKQNNSSMPFTDELIYKHINASGVNTCETLEEAIKNLLMGLSALFIEGEKKVFLLNTPNLPKRTPEVPNIETTTRGAQIGFVESGEDNVALIRSRIKSTTFRVKKYSIGERSQTAVYLCYMEDVANPIAIKTVKERLQAIKIDMINQSSDIQMRVQDMHYTPFPLMRPTQRIDNVTKEIAQGKFVIIADGDPTVILAPATLQDFYQTTEDFSHNFYEASFIRWLRVGAFFIALFLPSLYVALTEFNPEFLPLTLSLRIAESRAGVPFPAVIEVVMMELVIEVLKEATLRMPTQMGQTIGIVGGLVIGQATVSAGLVSNILIVIVAFTAIASFIPPSYEIALSWRLSKYFIFIATCFFGFYGMLLSFLILLFHLASLKSFGVTYLAPMIGNYFPDWVDLFVRKPLWALTGRSNQNHPMQDKRGESYEDPVPHPEPSKAKEGKG